MEKNKMKKGVILYSACVLLLMLTACAPRFEESIKPIRIGAILPLTGGVAVAGEFVRTGIVLASDRINAEGGINGQPIEIVFEDDECDPKKAITSYHKLVDTDRVPAIIGPFCSGSALAIAPLAEADKVITITSGATTGQLSNAGDFIFRVSYQDKTQAEFLAKMLESRYDSVAILLFQSQQGVVDMSSAFINSFKKNITTIQKFTEQDNDIRDQLTKIKESHPDALLVLVFPAQFAMVTKELNELGINLPLYAPHTFETPASLSMGKDAEKYQYSIQSYDRTTDEAKRFMTEYSQRFNSTPSVFASFSFDATMLIADATRKCNTNTTCTRDFLYNTQGYAGVSGTKSFDKNGDMVESFYELKTVHDGKFILV